MGYKSSGYGAQVKSPCQIKKKLALKVADIDIFVVIFKLCLWPHDFIVHVDSLDNYEPFGIIHDIDMGVGSAKVLRLCLHFW